ncbi:MAG: hypothetical protein FD137_840 [Spirochaetes bacterium]|nr:MAG: hypothetical protein FD137_840 [Spirochaetota bacterium]
MICGINKIILSILGILLSCLIRIFRYHHEKNIVFFMVCH